MVAFIALGRPEGYLCSKYAGAKGRIVSFVCYIFFLILCWMICEKGSRKSGHEKGSSIKGLVNRKNTYPCYP